MWCFVLKYPLLRISVHLYFMFVFITLVDFVLQWMHFSLSWKYPILCVSFHILHHFIFISDITTLTRPGAGTWKDVPSRARALWVKQGLCKQIRRQRESQWGSERARESQRESEIVRERTRENLCGSLQRSLWLSGWISPSLSLFLALCEACILFDVAFLPNIQHFLSRKIIPRYEPKTMACIAFRADFAFYLALPPNITSVQ